VTDDPSPVRDAGIEHSEKQTSLSVERTFLSFERTLMAWLRTSLFLISFGFTALRAAGLMPQWNLALWIAAPITMLGVFSFFNLLLAW